MKSAPKSVLTAAFVFALTTAHASAQTPVSVIRSNVSRINIRDGTVMKPWQLSPELRPDVFEAELINGRPHQVTFITDVDSLSFLVEEGKRYDFIIQKGDTANHQQIVGVRMVPATGVTPGQITLVANPERVCHDTRKTPYLNFDLILRNGSEREIQVREMRAYVSDPRGELVERRVVAQQALDLLGSGRRVPALMDGLIFNPFMFNSVQMDSRVAYEVFFEGQEAPVTVTIVPQSCVTKAKLILPVTGRIAVFDGHDVLSHHRRSGYLGRGAKNFGIIDNAGRFGLDLMAVDAKGRSFKGEGRRNEDYISWGQPVRAAGAGTVAGMHNEQPDNDVIGTESLWTDRSVVKNEMTASGNYVLIDHGNGEFSLAAHLRKGSVRVQKGQKVKAGEIIGEVGNSGSSLGPHLHFELRTGWGVRGIRGLPAYFHDVTVVGTGEGKGAQVMVNTGDVLLAK